MRWEALGVAALLVVSGCLAASANTESAESLESTATDRSVERLEAGDLVAAWAVEPPSHVENDRNRLDVYLDDAPGDGDAPGWAFAYLNDTEGGIVVVSDNVGVVAEFWHVFEDGEAGDVREEAPPIEGWTVDSQEAAETLAGDDRWPQLGASWAVGWRLMQHDGGPVWHVEASNVTFDGDGREVRALVSASNGTILDIEENGDRDIPGGVDESTGAGSGGCTGAEESGRVTPVSDVEAELELPEDGRIRVHVDYRGAGPLDVAILEDGEDEVWSGSVVAAGSGAVDDHVPDLEEGDYVVEASTDGGAVDVDVLAIGAWGHGCQEERAGPGEPPLGARPAASFVPSDPTMGLSLLDRLPR